MRASPQSLSAKFPIAARAHAKYSRVASLRPAGVSTRQTAVWRVDTPAGRSEATREYFAWALAAIGNFALRL